MKQFLRKQIAEVIALAGEGHIPSAYSIVDILDVLYGRFLRYDPSNPEWEDRDYFILSKGHGCMALYVVLAKYGFLSEKQLYEKGQPQSILGGHPDCTIVPGVEASTGSLGHGLVTALGIALGLRILGKNNRVVALIGDGESNEGTVWETSLVAANLKLGNLCLIVDNNGSAAQVLPVPNIVEKWQAFGWDAREIDGHNEEEVLRALEGVHFQHNGQPHVIIANTLKGKGVSFMEVHGPWHSRVPNPHELEQIKAELS